MVKCADPPRVPLLSADLADTSFNSRVPRTRFDIDGFARSGIGVVLMIVTWSLKNVRVNQKNPSDAAPSDTVPKTSLAFVLKREPGRIEKHGKLGCFQLSWNGVSEATLAETIASV